MKSASVTFSMLLLLSLNSYAQGYPKVGLFGDSVTTASGSLVHVRITVDSFQNMNNLNGSMTWDTSVATYDTVLYPFLSNWNWGFNTSNVANGELSFQHSSVFTIGPTLSDGDSIFSLRFLAKGAAGTSTKVNFSNIPVSLYWFNGFGWNGTIDSVSGFIQITGCQIPAADFSTSINGFSAIFSDLTTGNPVAWQWNFGDGNTSASQNPSHSYSSNGNYLVCLTVTDSCGGDSVCKTIAIFCSLPAASFLHSVSGLSVTFSDQTSGNPAAWSWNFGDGGTDSIQSPSHSFPANGTYEVCLFVSNGCGTDTFCDSVVINLLSVTFRSYEKLTVFPVPANDRFSVLLPPGIETGEIFVTDAFGRMVKNFPFSHGEIAELEIRGMVPGKYFVELFSGSRNMVRAIVVE